MSKPEMSIEFDFDAQDAKKNWELTLGRRVPYGRYTLILLLACAVAQILILWLSEIPPITRIAVTCAITYVGIRAILRFIKLTAVKLNHCKIEFHRDWLHLHSNESEFQRSYFVLRGIEEEKDHFVMRYQTSVILIPKRCLTEEQKHRLLNEWNRRIESAVAQTIPFYQAGIEGKGDAVGKFVWQQQDLDRLAEEKFVPFQPKTAAEQRKKQFQISGLALARFLLVPVAGMAMISVASATIVFVPAIVFFFGYWLLVELSIAQERKVRKGINQEVLNTDCAVVVGEDCVWLGDSLAVDRHAVCDVARVLGGEHFVAFQTHTGFLHALPRRAFGSDLEVQRFAAKFSGQPQLSETAESGNPFQSPLT